MFFVVIVIVDEFVIPYLKISYELLSFAFSLSIKTYFNPVYLLILQLNKIITITGKKIG
jgi:hypothetical protein